MFDIITFGSATRDIFLKSKDFKVLSQKNFFSGKGICFNLGSKIDVEDIKFSSGGGGTNTAAFFADQGFKTAFCGKVAQDIAGREIIGELKKLGVHSDFVFKTIKRPTNHSVVLSSSGQDRTILVYRGASETLLAKDIPWRSLKAKWFYLAPLSGTFCKTFKAIVNFAYKNKIKIAVNPGNSQLSLPKDFLRTILRKVDILILNQEEASFLTKVPYNLEQKIFQEIDKMVPGIAIMTKGPEGAVVSDGRNLFSAKPPRTKVVDRTGAGDAFGSGFISGFIRTDGDIEKALQLGIANSTACLKEWGAKNGLLKKGDKFIKVKVKKELCSDNNFCQVKL